MLSLVDSRQFLDGTSRGIDIKGRQPHWLQNDCHNYIERVMRTEALIKLPMLACLIAMNASVAFAQAGNGCTRSAASNPPRVVYRCANGLTLEAEAAAALEISGSSDQGRPDSVRLTDKAVLIEVVPGSGPFQILTPHAIAAVRGTIYAADVNDGVTSVFVVRGEVAVSRRDGSQSVTLPAGYGVDVSADAPLVSVQWEQAKATALLARFGR